jgi:glycosyltransferase involved in cell wall biosynthesis
MRLVVISDCTHYLINGRVYNKNPILTKQFDFLFKSFDEIILVAPLEKKLEDVINLKNYSYYKSNKLSFKGTCLVGGNSLKDKFKILRNLPNWIKLFWSIRNYDLYYLRFPNNINIISFILYWILNKKIIITYTGTWNNYKNEPITYRIQKLFIKYLHRGSAFVYLTEEDSRFKNIIPSFSPSFSHNEIVLQEQNIIDKIGSIKKAENNKIKFVSIGSIIDYKNQLLSIKLIQYLVNGGVNANLKIIGTGNEYMALLKGYVEQNSLQAYISFEGYLVGIEMENICKNSHFLVHTPKIEGYGKTPQEGLFYGLIPILSNFPFSSYFVGNSNQRGFIFDESDLLKKDLLNNIKKIYENKEIWVEYVNSCYEFSKNLTLDAWTAQFMNEVNKYKIEN